MYPAQKVFLVNRENASGTDGTNSCGSMFFLEQRHFAEEFVRAHRAQFEFFAIGFGDRFDFPLLHNKHAVADVALTNDYFTVLIFFSEPGHVGYPTCLAISGNQKVYACLQRATSVVTAAIAFETKTGESLSLM